MKNSLRSIFGEQSHYYGGCSPPNERIHQLNEVRSWSIRRYYVGKNQYHADYSVTDGEGSLVRSSKEFATYADAYAWLSHKVGF